MTSREHTKPFLHGGHVTELGAQVGVGHFVEVGVVGTRDEDVGDTVDVVVAVVLEVVVVVVVVVVVSTPIEEGSGKWGSLFSWIIIVSSFYVDNGLSEVGGKVRKVQEIEVNVRR